MIERKRVLATVAGGLGVMTGAGTVLAQASFEYTSSDPVRAYEAELVADASSRTSYLAAAGAGWEKGKFYVSDGDANTLNVGGLVQFRYLMNLRDDAVGDPEDLTQGFQLRRTRLRAGGTIWDKNLGYYIQGEFSRSTGDFVLLDAFGNYKFENGVNVRWGQYKVAFLREENISDDKQLTVERSTTNNVFNQGRSQGVGVGYTAEAFRFFADYTDGFTTLNTDFNSPVEADFALTGRGDFRWGADDFKRFEDFTSWRGSEFGGMAGAAVHYQSGGETGGPTADVDLLELTADVTVEGGGWNAYAAGIFRSTEPAAGASTDDLGFILQGGVFVSDQIEVFARYDVVVPDDTGGQDPFSTVTAGMNYYISPESHAVKFSADIVYYVDAEAAVTIVSPSTGLPLLADGEEGQIALRLQMQVIF